MSLTYDRHQFEKPTEIVGAKTGIDFAAVKQGIHITDGGGTTHHANRAKRWTPPWSADISKVRRIVAQMLYLNSTEGRGPFPLEEFEAGPLAFIHKYENVVRERATKVRWDVPHMCDEVKRGAERELAVAGFGYGKLLLSVIHMAYGERMTSAECSQALSVTLSPQGVRQWLCRANTVARRLYPEDCLTPHWTMKRSGNWGFGMNWNKKYMDKVRRKPAYRVAEFEAFGLAQEFYHKDVAKMLGISVPMVRTLVCRHRHRATAQA
jgi:hypothetical protein